MILLVLLIQVQVDWQVWLYGMRPGKTLGAPGAESFIMAPSGFFVSGYEGEARIYDPAGRLALSKEIKGKTLIGPLTPWVYFVVAGKQRAKVAVR